MNAPPTSLVKEDYIEINYDPQNEWLYVNWKGQPNHESGIAGCEAIIQALQKYPVYKILNDNRHVTGNWDEGIPWVTQFWIPRFLGLGCFYMAWVQSPCENSQASLQQALQHELTTVTILVFEDLETAAAWLKEV